MSSVTTRAQPALNFIEPNYSPWLRRALQLLIPTWMAWQTDIAEVETHNVETLAQLYQAFGAGKTRLLIAFRHPNDTDPYVLSHLLWQALPLTARQMDLNVGAPHSHFIYDRGIPLWAGRYLSWVFSRLGGVPIQRGKLDILALKTARSLFVDGRFPLAAAPEGGNNGHSEIVSPLEPGIAQLAFWCAEDLIAQGRSESVVILPVGIQYRYGVAPWARLAELIGQMEADSGLPRLDDSEMRALQQCFEPGDFGAVDRQAMAAGVDPARLYVRLHRLAEHLLMLMEGYYGELYGVRFETLGDDEGPNVRLSKRLQVLMDEALKVAEQYFEVRAKGSVIDRCRRLEQAGWARIFRGDTASLSPVALGLADRMAAEAGLRMWHMRWVERFVAVTGHYVKEHPSADRFAETALLLRDMMAQIKGKSVGNRPYLGAQRAIVTVGQPIDVGPRLGDYRTGRRGAIGVLTGDLYDGMRSLVLTG